MNRSFVEVDHTNFFAIVMSLLAQIVKPIPKGLKLKSASFNYKVRFQKMNQNLHQIFVPQIFNIAPTIPPKQTNAVFIHAWPCLEFLHYSCTRAQSSVHVEFAISS